MDDFHLTKELERVYKTEIMDRFLRVGSCDKPVYRSSSGKYSINIKSDNTYVTIILKNDMCKLMSIYDSTIIDRLFNLHEKLTADYFTVYIDTDTSVHYPLLHITVLLSDINGQLYIDVQIKFNICLNYTCEYKNNNIMRITSLEILYNLKDYFGIMNMGIESTTTIDSDKYLVEIQDEINSISSVNVFDRFIKYKNARDTIIKNYDQYNDEIIQYIPLTNNLIYTFKILECLYKITVDYYCEFIELSKDENYIDLSPFKNEKHVSSFPIKYYKEFIHQLSEYIKITHDEDVSKFVKIPLSGSCTKSASFK